MKKEQRKMSVRKLLIPMLLLVFMFSIIKAGVALASSDSFVIKNAEITDKSETVEVNNFSYEKCKITNDIVFHKVGDSVTYELVIQNNDDVAYTIKSVSDDNENAYIAYLYDSYEGTKIEAKGEVTFEITEKYAHGITDMSKRNQRNTVNISFALEDENGNIIDKDISVNPKTGDNAGIYVAMSIASLIMLLIVLNKKGVKVTRNVRKRSNVARISKVKQEKNTRSVKHYGKHGGRGFKMFSLFVIAALLIPTITKAVETKALVITFENNISLKDKLLVTYNIGDERYERVADYDEPIENLEDPDIPGYEFDGWETEDRDPFDPETPITDDITIVAKLTPITYTIGYELNGGTVNPENPTTYTVETNDIELTKPEKTGHTFTGWTGTELTGEVQNVTIAKGSIGNRAYTANWEINTYTITLDLDGGTGETSVTREYGDEVGTLPEPTKDGYDFDGWEDDNGDEVTEDTIVTGNMEVHAKWTPIRYTITYLGLTEEEKASLNNPTWYTIETPSFTLNNPQDRRDGDNDVTQRFVGWREVSTSISVTIPPVGLGNKTYEAIWVDVDPDVFTITYNLNGGTVTPDNRTSFTKFDTFTLNNPTKTGYDFAGWTGSNGTTPETNVTIPTGTRTDLTYTANWTPTNYTITYNLDNGIVEQQNPTTYTIESNSITLNNPSKTGYTFTGWTGTDLSSKTMEVTIPTGSMGDREYTANWIANTYTIIFDRNTGSGSMANQTMTYDVEANLNTNEFTKTGYTFAGWNTRADGQGTHYDDEQPVRNLASEQGAEVTLYAEWEANQYRVIFDKNNSSATGTMAPQTLTYDQAQALTENSYSLEHYKFMGWNTEANGLGTHYDDKAEVINLSTETDVTLYAEWKERTAMLQSGPNVNAILRDINGEATTFSHYTGTPDFDSIDGEQDIALATSNFPVYAWRDGENVYWWSEAEYPKMNVNSSSFFNGATSGNNDLRNLTTIDMTGLDASGVTNMTSMFANTTSLTTLNLDEFDSSSVTNMSSMFNGTGLPDMDLSKLETQNVTNMSSMFANTNMGSLDASVLYTSEVTNMSSMFQGTKNGTIKFYDEANPSASLFDTSKVTNMSKMFNGSTTAKLDLSKFNTSEVTNMNGMFGGAKVNTLDVSNWNTGKVTDMATMFINATGLKSLDLSHFDTKSVTTMGQMFDGMTSIEYLNLSGWTNENLRNMGHMFRSVGRFAAVSDVVIDLTDFKTPNVTSMTSLFQIDWSSKKGPKVLDLSSFNPSNVTSIGTMFDLAAIETIYVSEEFVNAISSNSPTTTVFCRNTTGSRLVGGAGTTGTDVNGSNLAEYARIDDPDNGKPGYFTLKNARYIRYNGNGADNEEPYGVMTSHYLSTTEPGNLKANAYTKAGYAFAGWNTEADGSGTSYTDEQLMDTLEASKTPLTLYAQWFEKSSTLNTGTNVNNALRAIASNATSFERYTGTPDWDSITGRRTISTNDSSFPVYAWYDEDAETIYWWSEVENPKMNANSQGLFQNLNKLTSIDVEGFDTSNVTNMQAMFNGCTVLETIDISSFNTENVTNMSQMFNNCKGLTTITLGDLDTSEVTTMASMFNACNALTELDVSKLETGNVTTMASMFAGCSALTELDVSTFNTGAVTTMASMFSGCTALTDLELGDLNTTACTAMNSMFQNCKALTELDVSKLETQNVTTMASMFNGCTGLTELDVDTFDTSACTSMASMFQNCSKLTSLDVSDFETQNVKSMSSMFNGCSGLTELELGDMDTSACTAMNSMFQNCSKLTSIDVSDFETQNVTNMSSMFDTCTAATSIVLGDIDTSACTNMSYMFLECRGLTTNFDVSGLDTQNVTNMQQMFYNCWNLQSLDVSMFDTGKVTNMRRMLAHLWNATTINVSGWNTSSCTDMWRLFEWDTCVQSLDLTSFDTSNVTDMTQMFGRCTSLKELDLSSWDTSKVKNMQNMFGAEYPNSERMALERIYVSDKFVLTSLTGGTQQMFRNNPKLVGGAGSTYVQGYGNADSTYAHIDEGPDNPGYFTDIADKPTEP